MLPTQVSFEETHSGSVLIWVGRGHYSVLNGHTHNVVQLQHVAYLPHMHNGSQPNQSGGNTHQC